MDKGVDEVGKKWVLSKTEGTGGQPGFQRPDSTVLLDICPFQGAVHCEEQALLISTSWILQLARALTSVLGDGGLRGVGVVVGGRIASRSRSTVRRIQQEGWKWL